jgi:hypothetical protein
LPDDRQREQLSGTSCHLIKHLQGTRPTVHTTRERGRKTARKDRTERKWVQSSFLSESFTGILAKQFPFATTCENEADNPNRQENQLENDSTQNDRRLAVRNIYFAMDTKESDSPSPSSQKQAKKTTWRRTSDGLPVEYFFLQPVPRSLEENSHNAHDKKVRTSGLTSTK